MNGELRPELAQQVDIGGLSVLREMASNAEFKHTLEQLKRNTPVGKERFFYGVISFPAAAVRYQKRGRFLCVYDTALVEKPHHADVMGPAIEGDSKGEIERRKQKRLKDIIDQVGPAFQSAAEFRGGAFVGYRRPPP
jgi:hypothetical protein